ncbi:MAG: ATP/GTP-binding protein [Candidatus Hermodarchaeota archaeon]
MLRRKPFNSVLIGLRKNLDIFIILVRLSIKYSFNKIMIIDHLAKTIQVKIVYFGPAMSGKTSTLKTLFTLFGKGDQLESIESTVGRTLFFDYGTISFEGNLWELKLHIYSTTGQDFYIVSRPITLRGIDGVLFIADSQKETFERNGVSWKEFTSYFSETYEDLPVILCFNKQDLSEKYNPNEFLETYNIDKFKNVKVQRTSAVIGEGILEAFEKMLNLIFNVKIPYFLEKSVMNHLKNTNSLTQNKM